MQYTLIVSSARSIQAYALAGNKLREMVGASALIDNLTSDNTNSLLSRVITELTISEGRLHFIRRQGGSLAILFTEPQTAQSFLSLWSAAIQLHVPGLQVDHAMVEGITDNLPNAIEEAHRKLNIERNRPSPVTPSASPLALRSQRTGLPAVDKMDDEYLDALQKRKRNFARSQNDTFLKTILPDSFQENLDEDMWPLDFEEIAGDGERAYLALVHADGNSLGNLVKKISESLEDKSPEEAAGSFLQFSNAIDLATRNAVAATIEKLFNDKWDQLEKDGKLEKYPFRPIVCAGDDLTVVLRAEDGLAFARMFLEEFRKGTEEQFNQMQSLKQHLPDRVEAAAGIAYVKSHFPFHLAYDLCESLCKHAKSRTQRKASALAFHRVTTSATEEYPEVLKREYRYGERQLTMNPYLLGNTPCNDLPSLAQLDAYRDAGRKLPRGTLRQTARDATVSVELAENRMERAEEVASKEKWQAFMDTWKAFPGAEPNQSRIWIQRQDPGDDSNTLQCTPLLDAIDLNVLEKSFSLTEEEGDAEEA